MAVLERLLERMQDPIGCHALDGAQGRAVGLDGQHRAGLDRVSINMDRAGAALSAITSHVNAGET